MKGQEKNTGRMFATVLIKIVQLVIVICGMEYLGLLGPLVAWVV